jgi:hypothetical protein
VNTLFECKIYKKNVRNQSSFHFEIDPFCILLYLLSILKTKTFRSGNYGLWDQLLAVEWIYENAHLFGGDRHRIVLAGHSAGAGNVMLIPGI